MFKRLKGMFGKKQPVISYNQRETRERCIQRIMSIHRMAIVTSGEERKIGLEDAVLNKMALEGFCEWITNCPDCFSRAAMAIDYIANFHPFAEGNKRTAFQLALAMLRTVATNRTTTMSRSSSSRMWRRGCTTEKRLRTG